MTISTITSKSRYAGDGATTGFPTGFKFVDNDHVKVILRGADGSETVWTEGSEYTLTGAGAPGGGTLTVVTSPMDHTPAAGETLVVRLSVPARQETSLPLGGAFPTTAVEGMADLAALRDQEIREMLSRAVKFKETTALADVEFPEPEAGAPIGWNADGDAIVNLEAIGRWQGDWMTAADYVALDVVREPVGKNVYVCEVAHSSGDFATDLAAGKWSLAINVADAEAAVVAAEAAQVAAEAAQAVAASSASAAATSETNAGASATAAAGSASTASAAATAAGASETAAAASETAAATSATNAAGSATAAQTAETNAETAETGAVAAKNAAEALYADLNAVSQAVIDAQAAETVAEAAQAAAQSAETNAETAETAAEAAQVAAAASAAAAATSETNAGNSATAAAASATAASGSATAAAASAAQVEDVKLIWQGNWSGATAYAVNDAVVNAGGSWVCIQAHTNQEPPNVIYWDVLAAKGDQGIQGIQGIAGDDGIGIVPQGAYGAGTAYSLDDGVTYQGSYWRSLQNANQGNTPEISPSFWEETIAKGDAGEQGPPGQDGSGVPAGGATGQTLRKASATNGDVEWGYALVEISQAAYDLLSPPDANTIYFITS